MRQSTTTLLRLAESVDALAADYVSTISDIHPLQIRSGNKSLITSDNLLDRLLPKKYLEDFHTTTLAYFLDYAPDEHRSRILLESFLQFLATNNHSLEAITPQFVGGFKVQQEAHSDGFIDILLTNPKANQAIIIENKIRAPDQGRQLPRYYWDIANNQNYQFVAIIYLSPNGHEPYMGDWTEDDLASVHPICFSYGTLIDEWLEPAITKDELQPIHTLLTWYCQIIKHLREVPMMKNMLQDFSAQLADNPTTLKVLADIVTERTSIECALCVSFYNKLVSRLHELEPPRFESFFDGDDRYVRFSCTDRIDYVLSFEENQYSYGVEFKGQKSKERERLICTGILGEEDAEVWTTDGFDSVFVYSTTMKLADQKLHKLFDPQSIDEEVKRIHTDVQKFKDAFAT